MARGSLFGPPKVYRNWVKACLASRYFKKGIEKIIDDILIALQKSFLSDICENKKLDKAECTSCTTAERLQCPNGICNVLTTKISSHHSYNSPVWGNTDATKWCEDPWEIGKCFLPAYGYEDKTSVMDTDLIGLLHLLINCLDMQSHFDVYISRSDGPFAEILRQRQKIFHSDSVSLSQVELEKYIDLLISVLEDKKELLQDVIAQNYVRKLKKLKDEHYNLSKEEKKENKEDNSLEETDMYTTALKNFDEHLISKMKPTAVVEWMNEMKCLPIVTLTKIEKLQDATEKNRIIIDNVIRRGFRGYKELKMCLRETDQNHLAEGLSQEEQERENDTPIATVLPNNRKRKAVPGDTEAACKIGKTEFQIYPAMQHKEANELRGKVHMNETDTSLNKKELHAMCLYYGRKSNEVAEACKRIRMQILACSVSFKEVIPTYQSANPNDIVFVVYCEPRLATKIDLPEPWRSFEMLFCNIGEYCNEDSVIPTKSQMFYENEKQDQQSLTDILRKTSGHFMKDHSNLNIITASPVKSKGFRQNKHAKESKPCIVFYVCLKGYIPIQENELPSHIGCYVTDIREGAFKLYNDTEPYLERLKMGCSIGQKDISGLGGTLGAFVSMKKGIVGCITSAHVLLDKNKLFESKHMKADYSTVESNAAATIYQPAPSLVDIPDKKPFGRVKTIVYKTGDENDFGVEAVLITIVEADRYPNDGQFPNWRCRNIQGPTLEEQLNYVSGKVIKSDEELISFLKKKVSCYKYGAKTGSTKGEVRLYPGGAVRTKTIPVRPNCELHKQIEICSQDSEPFADHGDSGALVLASPDDDKTDLYAIGILTGGTDDCSTIYVTPIWEVLNALELPLQLKVFTEPIETMTGGNDKASDVPENDTIKDTVEDIKNQSNKVETKDRDVEARIEKVETKVDNVEKIVHKISLDMKTDKADILAAIKGKTTNNI